MRQISYKRVLDIVSGSAYAGAKTKVQKSSIYRDFDVTKLEETRFRTLITANLPVFYVVDCQLIASEIIKSLKTDSKRFISKIFTESGPETSESVAFYSELETILASTQLVTELTEVCRSACYSGIKTTKSFLDDYQKLEKLYNKTIDELAVAKSYQSFKNPSIRLGYSIRQLLGSSGTYIASDAKLIVAGFDNSIKVLVISPTFDQAKRIVNESILAEVTKYLEGKRIGVTDNVTGFKIGNIVNAGHTAARTDTGKLLGINMPSAQQAQFLLKSSKKAFEIEQELAEIDVHVDYSIKFSQNFSKQATNLLDMQFAFIVSQPAALNTNQLNKAEQARIKKVIKDEILPSLKEQAKAKFSDGLIDYGNITASPSLFDHIEKLLLASLEGKTKSQLQKTNKQNKFGNDFKLPVVKNTGKTAQIKASSKKASVAFTVKNTNPTPVASLSNLESLLRANLRIQIERNMGSGNRKDVLNLRTGRFSSSARIDRVSQGRTGLISIYYTYMKNPYATFSTGGRQQNPTSRDPKKLITKSIREIVSPQVASRMRAVLV